MKTVVRIHQQTGEIFENKTHSLIGRYNTFIVKGVAYVMKYGCQPVFYRYSLMYDMFHYCCY